MLIENLSKDILQFENVVREINSEQELLKTFAKRINGPFANLDTLTKIARDEFRGLVFTAKFINDDSNNTMVLSNEINLFDNELKKKLFAVYNLHQMINRTTMSEIENYMGARKGLLEKYPSKFILHSGPIYESVWKQIDMNGVAGKFLFVAQRKIIMYGQFIGGLKDLIEYTKLLIQDLTNSLGDV